MLLLSGQHLSFDLSRVKAQGMQALDLDTWDIASASADNYLAVDGMRHKSGSLCETRISASNTSKIGKSAGTNIVESETIKIRPIGDGRKIHCDSGDE